jgi:type II secretory pathway predicted ATPase ExeA
MYEAFYGLQVRPFNKTPDPAFLYRGRKHAEALARLQFACEERELMVLSGEIGAGKTTLTRALVDELDEAVYKVALVINPRLSAAQLLQLMAEKLGLENPPRQKNKLLEAVQTRLYELDQDGKTAVLIIDEAQMIPGKTVFDELRLLTNYQLDDRNLIAVLLVGQPELNKRLAHPSYQPLQQRVGIRYHLEALDEKEVKDYLDFRTKVAGRNAPLFTDDAVAELYRRSGGVPRVINNLAGNSLLIGFGKGEDPVGPGCVAEAARELQIDEAV